MTGRIDGVVLRSVNGYFDLDSERTRFRQFVISFCKKGATAS
jgi:hypothetical protein